MTPPLLLARDEGVRFYDPTNGAFLSRDPLVSITREAYGYTGGNPLNMTDPSGLFGIPTWVPGIGGMCVDIADPNCENIAEQHPEVTQGVVDAAAGVVDGVTLGNAGWVTRGKVVNESSGWHVTGRLTGTALLVPFAVKGGARFGRFANTASWGSGASSCVNGPAGVWSVNCALHLSVAVGLGRAARPFKSIDEQMFNSVTLLLDPVAWLSGVVINGTVEC